LASNFLFEIKRIFYNYLPDIIAVNLILVFILFIVFFITHLLKKRRRYVDDTVPYVVYLKESIEQLVDEAEVLKRKLEKLKYNGDKSKKQAASSTELAVEEDSVDTDELERLNAILDEKDSEISLLKEELSKYENASQAKEASKDLIFSIELLKNENNELKEKLEEVSILGSGSNNNETEELRKHNLSLSSKLEELKTQLSEYEIIEDDLAELKKLKEENAVLKSQLLSKESINEELVETIVNQEQNKEEVVLNEEDILKDIEQNFNEIVSDNTSILDDELKNKIEKEIDEELEKELEELGLNNEDEINKNEYDLKKNIEKDNKLEEALDKEQENQETFQNNNLENDNIDKVKKEFDVDLDINISNFEADLTSEEEHSDLEFVGLPTENDAEIEKELEKLELEFSTTNIEKEDDKQTNDDKISSNESIDKELKEEFEKFLSES